MKSSTDFLSLACRISQISFSIVLTSSAFSMSTVATSSIKLATTKMLLAGISVKKASSFSWSRTSSSLSTASHSGLTSLHLCLCLRLTASHRGTDTGSPGWLEVERLEEVRDMEKEDPLFTEMPASNIFVVANLILDCAKEDIERADQVRMVLRDIWDIRQAKLRRSVDGFIQGGFLHSKLNHLQLIELNSVRPLLPHAFDQVNRLNMATNAARRAGQATNTSNRSFLGNSLNY